MRTVHVALISLLLVLWLAGCGSTPPADIVITDRGCAEANFTLSKDREPVISVTNETSIPMVLTIPRMVRFVVVPPGGSAPFELPRYIMGEFEYFCLGEAEHLALSGGNPFLCAAEPAQVAPVALSEGRFTIEPHERLEELAGPSN